MRSVGDGSTVGRHEGERGCHLGGRRRLPLMCAVDAGFGSGWIDCRPSVVKEEEELPSEKKMPLIFHGCCRRFRHACLNLAVAKLDSCGLVVDWLDGSDQLPSASLVLLLASS
ncbi:hypothetical protein ACLOJK_037896 [Asimina triloba]